MIKSLLQSLHAKFYSIYFHGSADTDASEKSPGEGKGGGGGIFTNMDLDQIKIRSKLRKKVSIEPVNQIAISMTSVEKIEYLMCFFFFIIFLPLWPSG